MNDSTICVDSNVLLKLVLAEDDSLAVRDLWRDLEASGMQLVAPALLFYEVASVLRNKAHRKLLTDDEADVGLAYLMSLSLTVAYSPELHEKALRLARRFGRPDAYDAHYLALAEELDCELWTADGRLYNAVHDRFPLIRMLGA